MSGNVNGHSWSKFFWRDWQGDLRLRSCSLEARGFWMDCLCAMHEGFPVGHLAIDGRPMTLKQIGLIAGISEKKSEKLLRELEAANVFSRLEDGTIFCRRMVRDAQASETGREHAGKRWRREKTDPNGSPYGEALGDPYAKSTESEKEEERGPPKSPRATGGLAHRRLSVTDQIRKDWGLGTFLTPDIRDDDGPPAIRLVS